MDPAFRGGLWGQGLHCSSLLASANETLSSSNFNCVRDADHGFKTLNHGNKRMSSINSSVLSISNGPPEQTPPPNNQPARSHYGGPEAFVPAKPYCMLPPTHQTNNLSHSEELRRPFLRRFPSHLRIFAGYARSQARVASIGPIEFGSLGRCASHPARRVGTLCNGNPG